MTNDDYLLNLQAFHVYIKRSKMIKILWLHVLDMKILILHVTQNECSQGEQAKD